MLFNPLLVNHTHPSSLPCPFNASRALQEEVGANFTLGGVTVEIPTEFNYEEMGIRILLTVVIVLPLTHLLKVWPRRWRPIFAAQMCMCVCFFCVCVCVCVGGFVMCAVLPLPFLSYSYFSLHTHTPLPYSH